MRHIAAENRRIGLIFWALRPWGGRIVEKQNPARKAHGAMKPHESAHFAPHRANRRCQPDLHSHAGPSAAAGEKKQG
ncbi:hypothetical protein [Novosphingobium humi]|uniref:hypothetical protein n=1 Tax=Novosphingobium humi TaxID=2282397 RepID=UPI0025AF9FDA|nr:hypothetical protein [Novosphingobium humi]WJS99852.1 hypothetical protein NYQ05_06860 [Novosphingobium humi]